MATFLSRLGRAAFRRRWLVLLLWTAALVAVGTGAAKAPAADDSGTSFMPGIEAQRAFDLIGERFPGADADGATARVVFIAPHGQQVTASHMRTVIDDFVTEAGKGAQVAGVVSPFKAGAVSKDASTAYATVTYTVASGDLTDTSRTALTHAVDHAREAGLRVEAGGSAVSAQPEAGGPAEGIGVAVAALVLLITFGSLAAAGLPLLTALVGVGLSMAGILALGSTFGLSLTTGTLASMLGLAVGIDYALFVVSRYREERARGRQAREAAGLAVGTAGSAVVFAGLTVVIALAGLSVVGVPMLTRMGLCAAAAVAVGVLVALTLVPALLGTWPDAVLARGVRRNRPKALRRQVGGVNGGSRWASFVVRRPWTVLLLCVTAQGALALPVTGLELGMPGDEAKPTSTTERRAYDALAEGFGAGFNGPLTVVVDARRATDPQAAATAIAERIRRDDENVARALRAGASGFLGKDVSAEALLAGIRTVADGETLLSPTATRSLISRFLATVEPSRPDSPERLASLTDREREVMALAALGKSNDEIAAHLVVSPLTVRSHVHRAMTKLQARDRAQLVVLAYQTGLVRAEPPQAR